MQNIEDAINDILAALKARGWAGPKKATKTKPSVATSPDGSMKLYFFMSPSSAILYSVEPNHGQRWLLGSGLVPVKIEGPDVEKFASMADDFARRHLAARSSIS